MVHVIYEARKEGRKEERTERKIDKKKKRVSLRGKLYGLIKPAVDQGDMSCHCPAILSHPPLGISFHPSKVLYIFARLCERETHHSSFVPSSRCRKVKRETDSRNVSRKLRQIGSARRLTGSEKILSTWCNHIINSESFETDFALSFKSGAELARHLMGSSSNFL